MSEPSSESDMPMSDGGSVYDPNNSECEEVIWNSCSSESDEEQPVYANLSQSPVVDALAQSETPSSSTTRDESSGITVMATSNNCGKRTWDKKYYCVYCDTLQSKLPRHLSTRHQNEVEVAQALADKNKSSRSAKLAKIRNLGNHKHNCEVLRSGIGTLMVTYRPKEPCLPADYGPCEHCFAYLVRTDLWKHRCMLKPSVNIGPKRKRYAHNCKLLLPPPPGASAALNTVLCAMKNDSVSRAAKSDGLILDLARKEYLKVGHDTEQHEYIRAKVRELGRLLVELRKISEVGDASLESFVDPTKFRYVISAARNIAGFSETTHVYRAPSLALKLGHSVKKCACIVRGHALEIEDADLERRAAAFHSLCEMKWTEEVSTHALRTLYGKKRNKTKVLPLSEDVIKLTNHLKEVAAKQIQLLNEGTMEINQLHEAYDKLNSVTLTTVLLFNRRRQGEASKMTVCDYNQKKIVGREDSITQSLSKIEQALCKVITRVELVGKRGNTVPVLFTQQMKKCIDLLLEMRPKVKIPEANGFVFARSHYGSLGHIRASDSLREASVACGAAEPDSLRGTKLRKHIATLSQIVNLKENEMDMLATFLGHDIRIHREYYRLPEETLQVAKVAKLPMAMEQGTMGSVAGKTLDDIDIDVDEVARLWSPYKQLYEAVQNALQLRQADAVHDLETALRRHKPDFICLLQNPPRSSSERAAVQTADTAGLSVEGQRALQLFTRSFIDEALLISDLFELSEYAALELLITGESQQASLGGLKRGLVAVLLYYDGRASFVNSLRSLLQASEGRTWALAAADHLASVATNFTQQLLADGVIPKIFDLLSQIDVPADLERLSKERALGNPRHRKQVTDKMYEVRQSLADCIFCWSCQTPFDRATMLRLLAHLRCAGQQAGSGGGAGPVAGRTGDGTLDGATLAVLMAALYALDVNAIQEQDAEDLIQKLPILSDPTFVAEIHAEITSPTKWAISGMKACVQFAWAVTLRLLSQCPVCPELSDYCEQDELLVNRAVESDLFYFLRGAIISAETFHKEEFYVRQLHKLLTNFLVLMPLKVKELRNHGDETARIIVANQHAGLEAPMNLRRDFEHLMLLLGELYGKDPLKLELSLEMWCPAEPIVTSSCSYNYRPPQRQVSLYKFVRLAGDLLTPPLFVPYVDMLTGLANGRQSAHHCFNLLKSNGTNGGQVSTVSWDHFFTSLTHYYSSLREQIPSSADMVHVYRHQPKVITPHEIDGIVAVLRLIQMIARHDDNARVALCENPQWLTLVLLLGIVGCSVPARLKGELLLTLAALAKTPEIAANLWQSIEMAQILPTVKSTSVYQPAGIQVELEEVEARNETFPLTIAFLRLLDALTESGVPAGLGTGLRAPGLTPYIDFVRDSVFLKFHTRAYKDPAEKWKVGCAVLTLLHKLVSRHEVNLEDFTEKRIEVHTEGATSASKPAGHVLMVHLLNNSATLKLVLCILDEACSLFDLFCSVQGQPELERCSLLCLQLLDAALSQQPGFLDALRHSGSALLCTPLQQLLLEVNPRSCKPDHLLVISKYVTYNSWLPEHSLLAVNILLAVCQSPLVQPKVVGILTADEDVAPALLHGFVECLECDELEDDEETETDEMVDLDEPKATAVRVATRQHILLLLLRTINQPPPNLAHFMLGFQLLQPLSKTNLQHPGVDDSPRTCLHSLLCVLDRGLPSTASVPSGAHRRGACAARLAYACLHALAAHRDTSALTLRYLRTGHDFLYRHLARTPFIMPNDGTSEKTTEEDRNTLLSQSWLLRTVAIELRMTSLNRQRSHTQRLLNLLLEGSSAKPQKVLWADVPFESDYSQYDMEFSMFNTSDAQQARTGGECRRCMLRLLDAVDFTETAPAPLQLDYIQQGALSQLMAACERADDTGVKLCDVRDLYERLTDEVTPQAATMGGVTGQRTHSALIMEIHRICTYAVQQNAFRRSLYCKRQAFDSWRQLVEIVLSACSGDLCGEPRQNVLFELLHNLLLKVAPPCVLPELSAPVAGVLLTLMAHLRHCFLTALQPKEGAASGVAATFEQLSGARTLFASSLQVALKGLIEHFIKSSGCSQRVRINLYGALLYCLHIAQKPAESDQPLIDDARISASLCGEDDYERITRQNMETICGYGDNLMEVICRDVCNNHDVGKMLSLATLDVIVAMDTPLRHHRWLSFLTAKGYLDHLCDALLQDDSQLQSVLHDQPPPLRALYTFESKMSLLTRLAGSMDGANALLQSRLMTSLAQCSVFQLRPETHKSTDDFVPSVLCRYRQQILFPVLKLCLAIMTSMGSDNRQAKQQILKLVVCHIDVFNAILRDRPMTLELEAMQELSLVTAVISGAATEESEQNQLLEDPNSSEFKGQLCRLQRKMIALLPRYTGFESLLQQQSPLVAAGDDIRIKTRLAVEETLANVLSFCRSIIMACSSQFVRILFQPSLVEAVAGTLKTTDEYSSTLRADLRPHNLGVLVVLLRDSVDQFLSVYASSQRNQRTLAHIAELNSDELRELCANVGEEKRSLSQWQQLATKHLESLASSDARALTLYSYIIENCLFILWRHLDWYLLRCEPEASTPLSELRHQTKPMRPLQGESVGLADRGPMLYETDTTCPFGVTRVELDQLREDLAICLSENLFSKIQQIEESYSCKRTRYGFVQAVVRRLRRLLQLHSGTTTQHRYALHT